MGPVVNAAATLERAPQGGGNFRSRHRGLPRVESESACVKGRERKTARVVGSHERSGHAAATGSCAGRYLHAHAWSPYLGSGRRE